MIGECTTNGGRQAVHRDRVRICLAKVLMVENRLAHYHGSVFEDIIYRELLYLEISHRAPWQDYAAKGPVQFILFKGLEM